jgi:hypothetical protein
VLVASEIEHEIFLALKQKNILSRSKRGRSFVKFESINSINIFAALPAPSINKQAQQSINHDVIPFKYRSMLVGVKYTPVQQASTRE